MKTFELSNYSKEELISLFHHNYFKEGLMKNDSDIIILYSNEKFVFGGKKRNGGCKCTI